MGQVYNKKEEYLQESKAMGLLSHQHIVLEALEIRTNLLPILTGVRPVTSLFKRNLSKNVYINGMRLFFKWLLFAPHTIHRLVSLVLSRGLTDLKLNFSIEFC